MEKVKINLYLWVGIIINILLVGFFVYVFYNSQPLPTDLIDYNARNVASISIYNEKLDLILNQLKKSANLPINVNPGEIGKENPYGL